MSKKDQLIQRVKNPGKFKELKLRLKVAYRVMTIRHWIFISTSDMSKEDCSVSTHISCISSSTASLLAKHVSSMLEEQSRNEN